jgi:hypothetical protein
MGDTAPPRTGGTEKDVLVEFLDYLQHSVVTKVGGAPEPDVPAAGVPSGTNVLGLVNADYRDAVARAGAVIAACDDLPAKANPRPCGGR